MVPEDRAAPKSHDNLLVSMREVDRSGGACGGHAVSKISTNVTHRHK